MQLTHTRRGLIVTFTLMAFALLTGAVVWACTMPVGPTEVTPGAGAQGDTIELATGTVSNTAEELSRCSGDADEIAAERFVDAECEYQFGIVDPAQVDNPNPQWEGNGGGDAPGATCHYETPQTYGVQNPDGSQTVKEKKQLHKVGPATHLPSKSEDGARALTASGKVPNFASDQTGATVACFYSSNTADGDGKHTNGQNNGAATATVPQPFVVLSS